MFPNPLTLPKRQIVHMPIMFVMSNFSFSHSVFKRIVLQTRENQGLFGNGLNFISYLQVTTPNT